VTKLIDPTANSNARLTSIFAAVDAETAGDAPGAPSPRSSPGSDSTPVSALAAMIGTDGDAQYAYSQILFGQLMALVVNMVSFGKHLHGKPFAVPCACYITVLCRNASGGCQADRAPACCREWLTERYGADGCRDHSGARTKQGTPRSTQRRTIPITAQYNILPSHFK
jgi:hypothetical protein